MSAPKDFSVWRTFGANGLKTVREKRCSPLQGGAFHANMRQMRALFAAKQRTTLTGQRGATRFGGRP
jgi:hypothetical protein